MIIGQPGEHSLVDECGGCPMTPLLNPIHPAEVTSIEIMKSYLVIHTPENKIDASVDQYALRQVYL